MQISQSNQNLSANKTNFQSSKKLFEKLDTAIIMHENHSSIFVIYKRRENSPHLNNLPIRVANESKDVNGWQYYMTFYMTIMINH